MIAAVDLDGAKRWARRAAGGETILKDWMRRGVALVEGAADRRGRLPPAMPERPKWKDVG